jgi:hypothetical protein
LWWSIKVLGELLYIDAEAHRNEGKDIPGKERKDAPEGVPTPRKVLLGKDFFVDLWSERKGVLTTVGTVNIDKGRKQVITSL